MRTRRLAHLGPQDVDEAYRFCEAHLDQCAFLAGWIYEGGLSESPKTTRGWLIGERNASERIVGLVFISDTGIIIPVLSSHDALMELVEIGRRDPHTVRVIVGARTQVQELWGHWSRSGVKARIIRDQIGYALERPAVLSPALSLSVARRQHLNDIVAASAAMAKEEAKDDPQKRNPELFRTRIRDRIQRGRDLIYVNEGRLLFKSNVSALSPLAGQIEGIYTMPSHRGQGLGTGGTRAVTNWVLARAKRAFLLVNHDNIVARDLYERLGYFPVIESQTIFVR